MITDTVTTIYRSVAYVYKGNLEGITDAESRERPIANANSVNWIAGHIVATRDKLFDYLGLEYNPAAWLDRYKRGNSPATAEETAPIQQIVVEFDRTYALLMDHIGEHDWTIEGEEEKLAKIAWYGFHEAYHTGQLGLLRKALGKEGLIR